MMLPRTQLASELGVIDLDLGSRPAQDVSHEQDEPFAVRLQTVFGVRTHLSLAGNARPAADGVLLCLSAAIQSWDSIRMTHPEVEFLDVDEASFFQSLPLRAVLDHREARSYLLAAFDEELTPLPHGRVPIDRAVVTLDVGGGLVALDPSARLANPESLGAEGVPVFDTANQPSQMDVIGKAGFESPVSSAVFDLTGMHC